MTTYAQVYDGTAHNVAVGDSFDQATEGKFNAQWVANEIAESRSWSVVPDGTLHGATDNNDGTFTNPVPPTPDPQPLPITKAQFQALYAAKGNDLTATLAAWPEG